MFTTNVAEEVVPVAVCLNVTVYVPLSLLVTEPIVTCPVDELMDMFEFEGLSDHVPLLSPE